MIIKHSLNQSLEIQDKNTLSGQMFTNSLKNTPILTPFKNNNGLDEMVSLGSDRCSWRETGVAGKRYSVSSEKRTVARAFLERRYVATEVYSIKGNR